VVASGLLAYVYTEDAQSIAEKHLLTTRKDDSMADRPAPPQIKGDDLVSQLPPPKIKGDGYEPDRSNAAGREAVRRAMPAQPNV